MGCLVNRILVLGAAAAIAAAPAQATVSSSFSAGVLTATSDAGDAIDIACSGLGGNATVNGSNPGSGAVACAAVAGIVVNGGPGANTLSLLQVNTTSFPAVLSTSINGAGGDDVLRGSPLADTLDGGGDADTVDGNQGSDIAFMGDGDDTFSWDPGDGSDVVEGQAGTDRLVFNGSNIAEAVAISANGARTTLFRNIANILMDLGGVERIEFNAQGGADTITVNPLAGAATTLLRLNLAAAGGATSDGQVDSVAVVGGSGADTLLAGAAGGQVSVAGDSATVLLTGADTALDALTLNAGAGNDLVVLESTLAGQLGTVAVDGGGDLDAVVARGTNGADVLQATAPGPVLTAGGQVFMNSAQAENLRIEGLDGGDTLGVGSGVTALFVQTNLSGGAGADILNGGNGAEVLDGGSGDDLVDGNQGNDLGLLGADNDTFIWDPGDGSDVVEGQGGSDVLRFNGSNISENISISANGARGRLLRDVGAIDMDFDDVERVDCSVLGGADNVTVGDLAPTDVVQARVLLASTLGGASGDGQADTVSASGSSLADAFTLGSNPGVVTLARAGYAIDVVTAEPANDRLGVNGLGGDDTLALTPNAAIALPLSYNGGDNSAIADAGDLLSLTGESLAETYTVTPSGASTLLARTSSPGFVVTIDAAERLQLDLGGGMDSMNTQLLPTLRQILDGGAPAALPGDSLNVANFTGDVLVSPITVAGLRPIDHANFEQTTNQQLFQAFLSGRQQTPPNPSPALGFGSVTLNPAQDAISVSLSYSGLLGANNAVRIHGPAPRGVAAASIIDLPASGATSGSFTAGPFAVTPGRVAELKQGLWYLNVSSTAPGSAGGEIRGQLDGIQFRDGFE